MFGDSVIQRFIDEMLRVEVQKEFMRLFEEDIAVPPNWQGFQGVTPIVDELSRPWEWTRIREFTPELFERMWESFSHEEKIRYVLGLIT